MQTSLSFLGALLRSCILLFVTSDLLRFAFLLMKDAWRTDAFELYRRLVVRDAWDDLDAAEPYIAGWSLELSNRQKVADVVFQCLLHVSINVVPLLLLMLGLSGRIETIDACGACTLIATFHIMAFYFLWLFGELTLKWRSFKQVWALARLPGQVKASATSGTSVQFPGEGFRIALDVIIYMI